MPIINSTYKAPSGFYQNCNLHTIVASLIRKTPKSTAYFSKEIETPDNDFFEIE